MIEARLETLAAGYVLGTLNPAERAELESRMAGNAELLELVTRFRTLVKPSKDLAMAADPLPTALASQWLPWALTAGLAVLCAIAVSQNKILEQRLARKTTDLYSVDSLNHALRAKNDAIGQMMTSAEGAIGSNNPGWSNLQVTMLDPLRADLVKAGAVTLWNASAQEGVLIVEALPPLPAGQEYQLWLFAAGQPPVKSLAFQADANGAARAQFKPAQPVKNVTKLEIIQAATGESTAPTGQNLILVGQ